MEQQQLKELIERYISDDLTIEEIQKLRQLLKDPASLTELQAIMDSQLEGSSVSPADYPEVIDRLKLSIGKEIGSEKNPVIPSPRKMVMRWLTAAAVLILIATLGFIWFRKERPQQVSAPVTASAPEKITPGKDGAILTLSDGRTIVLDSVGNGLIATQNGSQIVLNDGQVIYKSGDAKEVAYNTMSTPKGRQFRLVMPDGTRAWLNAASSLRYPTVFTGSERKVEVTGEVYFEVAKNQRMPFRVSVNENMEVVVLGTHFNINSYSNEASIKTTLLEGSVQIINGSHTEVLKPGQQAQVDGDHQIKVVTGVNLKKVMAWKNGAFDFDGASLQEVMRQLERWYDIEVVYEKEVPAIEFVGTMGRDLRLEEVLKGLKLSEVNFRLDGRKLIIMP